MSSAGECEAIETEYEHSAQPSVDDMSSMSASMDDFMRQHGRSSAADSSCGTDAMKAELEHHKSVACTGTTVTAVQAEASRHVGSMTGYVEHEKSHCNEAAGLMGTDAGVDDSVSSDDGSTCVKAEDGTFELDGGHDADGGTDGGHT
jgi:hypothetical protein